MADLSFTTKPVTGAPVAPNAFHNLSTALLADAIGELDCRAKAVEAEMKSARETLKARGVDTANGEHFSVTFSNSVRVSLDSTAIRAEMGEQWCDDRSKLAEVCTMRVTVNKAALALAA